MARPQQYDVFRPGGLPSASLGKRQGVDSRPDLADTKVDASTELDKVYNAWNVRIDKEVQAVAGGLRELVALADIGENPTPGTHNLTAFHLKLKTSSLIRAAQTLRDTAHELRLALSLGDDIGSAGRRDKEAVAARAEVDTLRKDVATELGKLAGKVPLTEDEMEEIVGEPAEPKQPPNVKSTGEKPVHVQPISGPPPGERIAPPVEAMDVDDDDEDEFEEV